jgi:hypothetical protein
MRGEVDFVADVVKGAGYLAPYIRTLVADGFQNLTGGVKCSDFTLGQNGAYFLDKFHIISSLSFTVIIITYLYGIVKHYFHTFDTISIAVVHMIRYLTEDFTSGGIFPTAK